MKKKKIDIQTQIHKQNMWRKIQTQIHNQNMRTKNTNTNTNTNTQAKYENKECKYNRWA